MKIKLQLEIDTEVLFLLSALKDRYNKVVNDELLWDSWELSANKRMQKQVEKFLKKRGIK